MINYTPSGFLTDQAFCYTAICLLISQISSSKHRNWFQGQGLKSVDKNVDILTKLKNFQLSYSVTKKDSLQKVEMFHLKQILTASQ